MMFVWLAIWGVATMILTTIVLSTLARSFKQQNLPCNPVYLVSGFISIVAALILTLIFGNIPSLLLPISAIFLILLLLIWITYTFSGLQKELLTLALCLGTVYLIPSETVLISALPVGLIFPLLGIGLYLLMRIFTLMDRVPDLSLITLLAQGVLIVLLFNHNIMPANMIYALFYLFVVMMSISQTTKALTGQAILGPFTAAIVGYIIGLLWTCVAAWGYIFAPVILYSYDIMELLLAAGITLLQTRRLYPFSTPFLIEQAREKNFEPNKLVRWLFLILTALSLLTFFYLTSMRLIKSVLILLLLFMVYAHMRLKRWGVPKTRFRDLGADLKAGFAELKRELNHIPLKKDAQTAPTPKKPVIKKKSSPAKGRKK